MQSNVQVHKVLLLPQVTCLVAYQTFLTKIVQLLQLCNSMQEIKILSHL